MPSDPDGSAKILAAMSDLQERIDALTGLGHELLRQASVLKLEAAALYAAYVRTIG
jgi:hypothetical protein